MVAKASRVLRLSTYYTRFFLSFVIILAVSVAIPIVAIEILLNLKNSDSISLLNINPLIVINNSIFKVCWFFITPTASNDSLLKDWMNKTRVIGKSQLHIFVRGLRSDIRAVRNAIKTNLNKGQVEEHVNRLKSIKQQYSRLK